MAPPGEQGSIIELATDFMRVVVVHRRQRAGISNELRLRSLSRSWRAGQATRYLPAFRALRQAKSVGVTESNREPENSSKPARSDQATPFALIFSCIMLPMFLALVDVTMIAASLPAIAAEFGRAEQISWIVTAYLIAATIAAPLYGQMGDVFGRKPLLFLALSLFILASVLSALSDGTLMLTLARALQGFGGGGMMVTSQAIIGDNVAPRERARYQGYLATVGLCASTIGPVIGGLIAEHFGWRSIFLISAVFGAGALVLACRLPARRPAAQKLKFDYIGLLLFTVFVITFLLTLQQVQQGPENWSSAGTLALSSLLSLVLLIGCERKVDFPIIPIGLLRHPAIWRSDGIAACYGALLVSFLTFIPMYLRIVHGASAAEIGILLLPMTVAIGIGSITTGQIISRTGRTAVVSATGLGIATIGLTTFALLSPRLEPWQASVLLGTSALFMGTVMAVVQVTVQASARAGMLGAAAASVQLSRSLGAAFATAATAMTLFLTLWSAGGEALDLVQPVLARGGDALQHLSPAHRAEVRAQFAEAFRAAFLTAAVFAPLGCVLAATLPLRRI